MVQVRRISHNNSTFSLCYIKGKFCCFLLEDPPHSSKIAGDTRVPAGKYRLEHRISPTHSERYGNRPMIYIEGIPNYTGVMFHKGNRKVDTKGCPLTGNGIAVESASNEYVIPAGMSTQAYEKFYAIAFDETEVEFIDEDI